MALLKVAVVFLGLVAASGLHVQTRPQDDDSHEIEDNDKRGMNEVGEGDHAKMNEATHDQADQQMNAGAGAGAGIAPVKRARYASSDEGAVPSTTARLASIIASGEDSELPDDGRAMNSAGGIAHKDMNKLLDIGAKSAEMNSDENTGTDGKSIVHAEQMNSASSTENAGVHAAMNGMVMPQPQPDTPEVAEDDTPVMGMNSAAKTQISVSDKAEAPAEADTVMESKLPAAAASAPARKLRKADPTENMVLAVTNGEMPDPPKQDQVVADMDEGDSASMKSTSDENKNLLSDMAMPQPSFSNNAGAADV